VSRIVRNEDGVFLEIVTASGGFLTMPLADEGFTAADQFTWIQPPPMPPWDAPEPVVEEPRVNEWPALLAAARDQRMNKRRQR
jgi:hypothetical protein